MATLGRALHKAVPTLSNQTAWIVGGTFHGIALNTMLAILKDFREVFKLRRGAGFEEKCEKEGKLVLLYEKRSVKLEGLLAPVA